MSFQFRWKHKDGSIVEFSEKGWRADDPEKDAWLNEMSAGRSPSPVLTLAIKIWLQSNCELVQSKAQDEAHKLNYLKRKRGNESNRPEEDTGTATQNVGRPIEAKSDPFRRRGRNAIINHRSIELACEEFFRSRGMPLKGGFNQWPKYYRVDDSGNETEY
jgi:hypothetical protein